MVLKVISISVILLLVISCSTLPRIESDFDNNYDLSSYKTFSIETLKVEESSDQISLNPILSQRFKRSLISSLTNKGLVHSDNSAMVVRIILGTWREVDRSAGFDSGFYGRRHYASDQRFYRVDKDGISIRFHDKKTDEVFWYAFSRFNRSKFLNDQEELDAFVEEVLNRFNP